MFFSEHKKAARVMLFFVKSELACFFSKHKKAARVADVRQIQRKLDLEPHTELSYVYMSSSQLSSSYFTE